MSCVSFIYLHLSCHVVSESFLFYGDVFSSFRAVILQYFVNTMEVLYCMHYAGA